MNAKKIWTTCALAGLAVIATASGSSGQVKGPEGFQVTDIKSTASETGTPFCFGDGSSGKCASQFPSKGGHGCENSLGLGGGRLTGHGSARLCDDKLVLEASNFPVPTTLLFLESTDRVNKGMGLPFGDGLMCLSRNVHRIAIQQPRGVGMANYPMPGDSPLGIAGKVDLLQPTRYYQVMYRDSGTISREKHFNLTNALEVVWGP